jgi:carotenoid cleavage dioxygenase
MGDLSLRRQDPFTVIIKDELAMSADPYLANNFGPVAEETTATDLEVVGTIPADLNGRYLRNGPNPLGAVDRTTHHWFAGPGMVHGVRLDEGRASWYRNRWVRSPELVEALGEENGDRNLGGSNNTHVIGHAGRTWAIVEAGSPPVELSDELDTVGANNFFGTLPDQAFSAHPKIDPDTGDLHAMAYSWPGFEDHVQYVHVGRDGRVIKTVDVPVPGMVMMHDMSLTEHYAVIYDLPVTVSGELLERGMNFPFAWNADYAPRVGLLPRDGTAADVIWCDVNPCYVFHPMNAYEDEAGNVVLDVCRYERMFEKDTYGPFGDSVATLDRWTVNPTTRKVNEQRIDDRGQEFPRCHPGLNGKPYRYGYSVVVEPGAFPRILKHDVTAGTTHEFDLGPGRHSGEPYFVPREGAQSEDDGYLMTYVYDEGRDKSELLILDAHDPSQKPLAQVLLPARVPYGFHGSWIAEGWDGPSV